MNQNLGTALQLMGKYRESEEHFERALHLLGLSLKTGQARRLGLGSALTLLGSALTLLGSALILTLTLALTPAPTPAAAPTPTPTQDPNLALT